MANQHLQEQFVALLTELTQAEDYDPTLIPELSIFRQTGMKTVEGALYEPSICLVAQGVKEVDYGDETLIYKPDNFLIASIDLPTSVTMYNTSPDKPYLGIKIRLSHEELAESVLELREHLTKIEHHQSLRAFNVGHLDDDLQRVVVSLVKLLKEKDTIDLFLPLLKKELIYRVFLSDIGAQLLAMVNSNGRDFQLVKSVRWIRHNYAEKISVDQLAEMSAMSVSRFHHYFRILTGFSPLQYQKRLRLHQARRLMLTDKVDAAEAAYSVGYESPSQFNREYRRVYGAPPRTDLRQQSH